MKARGAGSPAPSPGSGNVVKKPARAGFELEYGHRANALVYSGNATLARFAGFSMGGTGLEPVTPSLSSWCSPN
jgi:hypothetical protein